MLSLPDLRNREDLVYSSEGAETLDRKSTMSASKLDCVAKLTRGARVGSLWGGQGVMLCLPRLWGSRQTLLFDAH